MGTPFMLMVIGSLAFVVVKSALQARKVRRGFAARQDLSDFILMGIVAGIFLLLALLSVWTHYRAPT